MISTILIGNIAKMFFPLVLLCSGIVFLYDAYKKNKVKYLIKDTPTSKIRSVAMGLSEIYGSVKSNELLKTPISKKECVCYEYLKERFISSKNGSHWRKLESKKNSVEFIVDDGTGEIIISPKKAQFLLNVKYASYFSCGFNINKSIYNIKTAFSFNKDKQNKFILDNLKELEIVNGRPKFPLAVMNGDIRIIEKYVALNDNVYVIGTVGVKEKDKHIIKKGNHEKTFVISDKTEKELIKIFKKKVILAFIFGFMLSVVGAILFFVL